MKSPRESDITARVRGNTGSAAFTGALLVVFGFFWFKGPLDTDTGLLLAGNALFTLALRLGGLLLIGAAILCSIGIPIALLLDALFSILIGISIVLSAVLMVIGDFSAGASFGIDCAVFAVCGIMLVTAGARDLADYRRLPAARSGEGDLELDGDLTDFAAGLDDSSLISPPTSSGKGASQRHRPGGSV